MRAILLCFFYLFVISAQAQSEVLIPFLQDTLYGYANLQGELIIPAEYDEADFFDNTNSYALVKQNEKWYVINRKGHKLEHAEYSCKPGFDTLLGDRNGKVTIYTPNTVNGEPNIQELIDPNPSIRVIKHPCSCDDKSDHIIVFHIESFNSVQIHYPARHLESSCFLNISRWYKNDFLIAKVDNTDNTKRNTHHVVYDDKLDPILESNVKPEFLNDSWLYYKIDGQANIYDIHKAESFPIPFENVKSLINNKFLIVTGGSHQQNAFYGRKNYGLCDLKFNLILDTTYNYISQQGDFVYAHDGRWVVHLFDYAGNKLIDSAKQIRYNRNTSQFIIKDSLDKSKLYTADLKILTGHEYDDIKNSGNAKYYQYNQDNMAGILDSTGTSIIEYPCDRITPIRDSDYYRIMINKKNGVIDKDLNIVISSEYRGCSLNSYGFFKVSAIETRKNGLINIDGKIIIDTFYERINYDSIDNQLYIHAERDRKWTYFDTEGNIVRNSREDNSRLWTKEKKEAFAKIQLHYIQNRKGKSPSELFAAYVEKHEHMNPNSIMLHPKKHDELYASNKDLEFIAGCSNEKANITKYNGNNGLFAFKTDKGEGIINFENEIILPVGDREILDIEDHYILIRKDKKYDFYDVKMKKLYPFSFDYADDFCSSPLRVVSKNITGSAYEYISESCFTNTTDTLTRYKQNYGYVDKYGKIFIAPKYAFAKDFYDGIALVGTYDEDNLIQCSVIDTVGNVVKEYDPGITFLTWSTNDYCHQAIQNKHYGILDSLGNTIIPFNYKSIQAMYKDKLFSASDKSGSSFIINKNEKKLFRNKILGKIGPSYYDSKFIPLDGDKYVFAPNGQLVIVDYDGNNLLSFKGQNATMEKIHDLNLLKVDDNGFSYFVDPNKLVVYRK